MLNVNAITAKLAKLPDQQLQQYAAMNKQDPYVLSLAVSEANRRKAMRSSAQAQAPQQQPSVADQEIAQMGGGIAALPAGDMDFAEGGVVGYAGGARVTPYSARMQEVSSRIDSILTNLPRGGLSALSPAQISEYQSLVKELNKYKALDSQQARIAELETEAQGTGARALAAQRQLADTQRRLDTGLQSIEPSESDITAPPMAPPMDLSAQKAAVPVIDVNGTMQRGASDADFMRALGRAAQAQPEAPAQPRFEVPEAQGIAQIAPADYAGAIGKLRSLYPKTDTSGLSAINKERYKEDQARDDARIKREQEFQAEQGEYGKERAAQLEERGKRIEEESAQSKGMAILQAGLAMMSGTSEYALENIGKGAMAGLAQYKGDLKELSKRRDALEDATFALADAQRSEKRVNRDRLEALQEKRDASMNRFYDTAFGIASDKMKLDADRANALATAAVQAEESRLTRDTQLATAQAQMQSADRRAAMSANAQLEAARMGAASRERIAGMPSADMRLYEELADETSAVSRGLARYAASMGKNKDTTVKAFTDFYATLNKDAVTPVPVETAMQQFIKTQIILGGTKLGRTSGTGEGPVLQR